MAGELSPSQLARAWARTARAIVAAKRAQLQRQDPGRWARFQVETDPALLELERSEAGAAALESFARTLEVNEGAPLSAGVLMEVDDDVTPSSPPSAELVAASEREEPTSPGWRRPRP